LTAAMERQEGVTDGGSGGFGGGAGRR